MTDQNDLKIQSIIKTMKLNNKSKIKLKRLRKLVHKDRKISINLNKGLNRLDVKCITVQKMLTMRNNIKNQ